jgi:hypothetical protein
MAEESQRRTAADGEEILPPYVVSDADRERWQNARIVAENTLGPDATPDSVWQLRRTIFHNRTEFPD